jgi:dTDP-glucose 4,6-dehydratase
MKLIVTGGAGFIGSAVVRRALAQGATVTAFDAMTYAASPSTLDDVRTHPQFRFVRGDICDTGAVAALFNEVRPDAILHLAAETHVDRSIDGPGAFVRTNVVGTQILLDAALACWKGLAPAARAAFRFHHVSTDEVFGALGPDGFFTEETRYDPRSPYAASKAASDHLVRAWGHTYGLPVVISNCTNNYGPYQFPEKLIPLMILKGLRGEKLPVYGDGRQVRDWLHVDDHAAALWTVLTRAAPGSTYAVGDERDQPVMARRCAACPADHVRRRPPGP